MAERDVRIRILSKDQASAQLKRVGASVGEMAAAFVAAQASIAGVTAIFRGLGHAMSHAIELASIQEESERKLEQAFRAHGVASAAAVDAARAYAAELQQQSRYGDEAIMVAQRYLVTLGGLTGEGLNRATRATLDLAEAIDVDLKSAAMLLAKAAAGSTEALSRYGIVLDDSIPKGERFNAVLDQIEKKMGGSAKAATETYQGAVDQLANAWGDFVEKLGTLVTESGPVRAALKAITNDLLQLNYALDQANGDTLEQFRLEIAKLTLDMASAGRITREQGKAISEIAEAMAASGMSYVAVLREVRKALNDPGGLNDWIRRYARGFGLDYSMWLADTTKKTKEYAKTLPDADREMAKFEATLSQLEPTLPPDETVLGVLIDQLDELTSRLDPLEGMRGQLTAAIDAAHPTKQTMAQMYDLGGLEDSLKDVDRQVRQFGGDSSETFLAVADYGKQAAEIIGNAFAAQFARLIVEGGKLKDLLKDLLKLAIQIAVELGIRAAVKSIFHFGAGGMVPAHAAAGLVIGPDVTVDTVPVLLSPGEVVLSRPEAERYRSGGSEAPAVNLAMTVVTDRRRFAQALARDISDLVRRRGATLVASEVT